MGEKFNAPDPGATQPTTADEAGQRSGPVRLDPTPARISTNRVAPADVDGDGTPDVVPPADDPGAEPDAASRNFYKFKNDSPTADDTKGEAVQRLWPIKMQNFKSDSAEGVGPPADDPGYADTQLDETSQDAATSKKGYDILK